MLAGGQLSRMTVHASASLVGSLAVVIAGDVAVFAKGAQRSDDEPSYGWLLLEFGGCSHRGCITGHRAVLGFDEC